MSSKCKICNKEFPSDNSLHKHLKNHGITMPEYYVTYYARKNLLTKELLPFKNKEEYFFKDFDNVDQMNIWCSAIEEQELKKYITLKLRQRTEKKQLLFGPTYIGLKLSNLPDIKFYKKCYGSYSSACSEIGLDIFLSKNLPKNFWEEVIPDMKIFIDTREQKPLKFKNSEKMKLDVGDYTSSGEYYDYTFVDRKSEGDFKSTFTTGFNRFRKEMQRAKDHDSFMFIVCETTIKKIEENNGARFSGYKIKLPYLWSNVKKIQNEFPKNRHGYPHLSLIQPVIIVDILRTYLS